MKIKKILQGFLMGLFVLAISLPSITRAQEDAPLDDPTQKLYESILAPRQDVGDGNFEDYYHFGKVSIEVVPDENQFKAGEKVNFSGVIKNANEYPLFDGEVYVQIFRKQSNSSNQFKNGDDLVDQFFLSQKFNLDSEGKSDINFGWVIPENAKAGNYKIGLHFIVARHYNMSGLSFLNNVYAGTASFKINSNASPVYIDRNNVRFNGEVENQRSFDPVVSGDQSVKYEVPIINPSNETRDVIINKELYYWDGVNPENLLEEESKNISLSSGQMYNYVFDKSGFDEPVYFLVVQVIDGSNKSTINLRFSSLDNSRARINYSGVDKFPLKKGDEFTLFTNFHSVSENVFNGEVEVTLKDRDGDVLETLSYQGEIPGNINMKKKETKAKKNLDYAVITSTVKNDKGDVVDQASIVLDASTLSSFQKSQADREAADASSRFSTLQKVLILIIVLLFIISLIFIVKHRSNNKYTSFILVFALIFFAAFAIWLFQGKTADYQVQAQTGTWIEGGDGSASITIGNWKGTEYAYMARKSNNDPYVYTTRAADGVFIDDSTVTLNYSPTLYSATDVFSPEVTNVAIKDTKLNFDFSRDAEWITTGYGVDSPPAHWRDDGTAEGNRNYFNFDGSNDSRLKGFLENIGCNVNDSMFPNHTAGRTGIGYAPLVIQNPEITLTGTGSITCENRPNICHQDFTGTEKTKDCDPYNGTKTVEVYDEKYPDNCYRNASRPEYGTKNCSSDDQYVCDGASVCWVTGSGAGSVIATFSESKMVQAWANSCTSIGCGQGDCLGFNCKMTPVTKYSLNGSSYSGYIPVPSYSVTYNFNVGTPPIASAWIDNTPSSGWFKTNNDIQFNGTGTAYDGKTIVGYQWFQGEVALSSEQTTASFQKSAGDFGIGDHTVCLKVKDSDGMWSDCSNVTFTVKASCASLPAGAKWCPGDNEDDVPLSRNGERTEVPSLGSCTSGLDCEYYNYVDPEIGEADGGVFCTRPASDELCSQGTATDVKVSEDGQFWLWTCVGINSDEEEDGKAVKSCAYTEVSPN